MTRLVILAALLLLAPSVAAAGSSTSSWLNASGAGWTTPTNATAIDGTSTTHTAVDSTHPTGTLSIIGPTSWSPALPSCWTLDGVDFTITRKCSVADKCLDNSVKVYSSYLSATGNEVAKAATYPSTLTASASYGSSTEMFGLALTKNDFDNPLTYPFEIQVSSKGTDGINRTVSIDGATITIYYTECTATPTRTGTFTQTPTVTATSTATHTATVTSTVTATNTVTATATSTNTQRSKPRVKMLD